MSEIILPRKAKAAHWRELFAEQAASGQTIPQFCLSHNINSDIFYYWRKKFRTAISVVAKQKNVNSRFVSVSRQDFKQNSPRITLPNGVTIDLGDGLDASSVNQFLLFLCGVGLSGGADAKS